MNTPGKQPFVLSTFAQNFKTLIMKKILFALVLINFLTFTSRSQCSFGSFPPSYTVNPGWTNGAWLAQKYTLSTTATLTGLGLNSAAASAVAFRMAIYTDASNTPGNLVSVSNQGTMALGPNIVSLPSHTVISAGNYWIVAIYGGSGPTTYSPGGTSIAFLAGSMSTPPANGSSWNSGSNALIDYWAVINSPTVTVSGSTIACTGSTLTLTAGGATSYTWNTGTSGNNIMVSPTTNTTYTVFGTDANGCVGAASHSLISHTSPSLSISGNSSVCAGAGLSQTVTGAASYTWNTGANTNTVLLSPSTNTVYTVTGSDAVGCTGTASTAITVNSLPVLSITGNTAICTGATLSQTVSGASSYTWSTGAISSTLQVSPSTNTTYVVNGSDQNGCAGSTTVSITVNALPNLTISSTQPTLCLNETASLSLSGANTYTWNDGSTNPTLIINPTLTTTYSVTGMNINGCENTATFTQAVEMCTGINKQEQNNLQLTISPNPGTGIYRLTFDSVLENLTLDIYNSTGMMIKHDFQKSDLNEIDLSAQANGLYYLVVRLQGNQFMVKLVKE